MDLGHAFSKHAEWKQRFADAMVRCETLDAEMIGKDDACELGAWLHGPGRNLYLQVPAHAACLAAHAAFHAEAGRVALAINAGRYAEAEAMLGSGTPYAAASVAVGAALRALTRVVGA
jgi:methyl-accepting chemotaxis protein